MQVPMHTRMPGTLGALALALLLPAPATAADTSGCRVGPLKTKVETLIDGACKLRTTTAKVTGHKGATTVALSGQELTCGAVKLGSWRELVKTGLEACRENRGELDYSRSYQVRGIIGKVVGVDCDEGGYTGGAHGTAYTTRRSYDLRSGKELTLAQLYPKRHARLTSQVRTRFDGHKEHEGYEFEPKAFVLQMHKQGQRLEFAMPHSVETNRGSTLKLHLDAGPPAPAFR